MWRWCLLSGIAVWLAAATPASAFIAYVSNEKSNTVSVIDTDKWTVTKTIKVGQRPRGIEFTRDGKFVLVAVGDDDKIEVIDAKSQEVVDSLPSGPDPELFTQDAAGKFLSHVRQLVTEQGIGVLWATHLFDEIIPGDDLVVLHQGRVLAHGPVGDIVADAGAHDINSAFMRLTGATVDPGSPAP